MQSKIEAVLAADLVLRLPIDNLPAERLRQRVEIGNLAKVDFVNCASPELTDIRDGMLRLTYTESSAISANRRWSRNTSKIEAVLAADLVLRLPIDNIPAERLRQRVEIGNLAKVDFVNCVSAVRPR